MALPPVIEEIVRLIGHGPAMELVRGFNGQELRFPKTDANANWAALAKIVGEPATRRLVAAFGGEEIYIPFCDKAIKADRNRRMIVRYDALLAAGRSSRGAVSVLVREFRLCYRQIERIVNAPLPAAEAVAVQAALF